MSEHDNLGDVILVVLQPSLGGAMVLPWNHEVTQDSLPQIMFAVESMGITPTEAAETLNRVLTATFQGNEADIDQGKIASCVTFAQAVAMYSSILETASPEFVSGMGEAFEGKVVKLVYLDALLASLEGLEVNKSVH
ncbi:hypothetical protein AB4254_13675 [Vibrio breoganii]